MQYLFFALLPATLVGAVSTCPISLAITLATNNTLSVDVLNLGTENLVVWTPDTVFSELPTEDLIVTDSQGSTIPFNGFRAIWPEEELSPHYFIELAPGGNITTTLNAAAAWDLESHDTINVTVSQTFRYNVTNIIPSHIEGFGVCEVRSNTITFAPNKQQAKAEVPIAQKITLEMIGLIY